MVRFASSASSASLFWPRSFLAEAANSASQLVETPQLHQRIIQIDTTELDVVADPKIVEAILVVRRRAIRHRHGERDVRARVDGEAPVRAVDRPNGSRQLLHRLRRRSGAA